MISRYDVNLIVKYAYNTIKQTYKFLTVMFYCLLDISQLYLNDHHKHVSWMRYVICTHCDFNPTVHQWDVVVINMLSIDFQYNDEIISIHNFNFVNITFLYLLQMNTVLIQHIPTGLPHDSATHL